MKSIALRQYGLFPWNAETGEKKREKGEKPNTENVLTVKYDFYGKIKLQDVTIRSGSLVHGWIIKVFALIARKMKRKVYMWRSLTHKCCSPFFLKTSQTKCYGFKASEISFRFLYLNWKILTIYSRCYSTRKDAMKKISVAAILC